MMSNVLCSKWDVYGSWLSYFPNFVHVQLFTEIIIETIVWNGPFKNCSFKQLVSCLEVILHFLLIV